MGFHSAFCNWIVTKVIPLVVLDFFTPPTYIHYNIWALGKIAKSHRLYKEHDTSSVCPRAATFPSRGRQTPSPSAKMIFVGDGVLDVPQMNAHYNKRSSPDLLHI